MRTAANHTKVVRPGSFTETGRESTHVKIVKPEQKSRMMARITKTDTKPELAVRQSLFRSGFRYRLYDKQLPGTPDIVMRKYALVIQVNGCFWHGHKRCKLFREPRRNREYWIPKIAGNMRRDQRTRKELRKLGWKVFTVWECELAEKRLDKTMSLLVKDITKRETQREGAAKF